VSICERGDIVLGWLTKLVVVLSVLGLVAFDALSIGVASLSLADDGRAAAREASSVWLNTGRVQPTYDAAVLSARGGDPGNDVLADTFTIAADGTVTLTIRRTPPTLVAHYVGPLREQLTLSRTESARAMNSSA
jgi:hypothetical protein